MSGRFQLRRFPYWSKQPPSPDCITSMQSAREKHCHVPRPAIFSGKRVLNSCRSHRNHVRRVFALIFPFERRKGNPHLIYRRPPNSLERVDLLIGHTIKSAHVTVRVWLTSTKRPEPCVVRRFHGRHPPDQGDSRHTEMSIVNAELLEMSTPSCCDTFSKSSVKSRAS